MASACVNNNAVMLPEKNFLGQPPAKKYSSFGWLSPRISEDKSSMVSSPRKPSASVTTSHHGSGEEDEPRGPDLEASGADLFDFEFRLEDPVTMLPADELFCDGKLVPLHASWVQRPVTSATASSDVTSPPKQGSCVREINFADSDQYLFSPKAPRCSSRWKEILGLKKLYNKAHEDHKTRNSPLLSSDNHNRTAARSIRQFLHARGSKPWLNASIESASLSTPLLKDSDSNDLVSFSSRLSLSSSTSSHDHDDVPRLSLDSDHKTTKKVSRNATNQRNLSKVRVVKHRSTLSSENASLPARVGRSPMRRAPEANMPVRGVSVDSPRMNSSGKIVFNGLERSSSSPSTFNGSHRYHKQRSRGMERSYSAHVRVTPVLNVPVCSLKSISSRNGVYGLFSAQPKRDTNGGGGNKSHVKNRTAPRDL